MKKKFRQLILLMPDFLIPFKVSAQTTETSDFVTVNSNCGMRKKKIEKSAIDTGIAFSFRGEKTKMPNEKLKIQNKYKRGDLRNQKLSNWKTTSN